MTTTNPTTQVQNILERAVVLLLSTGSQGNTRKVTLASFKVEATDENVSAGKDEVTSQKKLFASKDLSPARNVIASVKNKLRALSLDGGHRLFGAGTYLVPLKHVELAEQTILDGQKLLAEKVEELVAILPRVKEQRKEKLGKLYRESDYPTGQDLRDAFSIQFNFASFGAPERLEEVSAAAYARAVKQHQANLSQAYEDVITGLRESALLVVSELAERLGDGKDGKPKTLKGTALRDVQDLLGKLPVLNSVGEDGDLVALLTKVQTHTQGVTVDMLRDAPAFRSTLKAVAEDAKASIGKLVTERQRAMELPSAADAA